MWTRAIALASAGVAGRRFIAAPVEDTTGPASRRALLLGPLVEEREGGGDPLTDEVDDVSLLERFEGAGDHLRLSAAGQGDDHRASRHEEVELGHGRARGPVPGAHEERLDLQLAELLDLA